MVGMTDPGELTLSDLCVEMRDGVFAVDREGRITFANRRLLEVGGLDREQVVGADYGLLEPLAEDGFEGVEAALSSLLGTDDPDERRVEVVVNTPGGGEIPLELRMTPMDSGGVLVVMRDVTERKRHEAELERRGEQLAVLTRLLAHDIRNDANVVAGWSEQLASELDDPDQRAAVQHVQDAATHIVELTHRARDVQAIIDEEGEMDLSTVALDRVIREEVEKVRERYPEATVTLATPLPSVRVAANELLGSVVANLLNNAVLHNDGDDPRVEVRAERAGDEVAVTVADDGPGVPPEQRAALFERAGGRLDRSASGMGLYIVATLVEEFGGSIDVGDAALGGAAFTVRLPVAGDA